MVVDADDQVVKGLDRLLTRVGLIVTGTHDPVRARDQLLNKFFAVALVDADTPTPGGGIELLQFARDKSPLTSVVVMTARKSYETATELDIQPFWPTAEGWGKGDKEVTCFAVRVDGKTMATSVKTQAQ